MKNILFVLVILFYNSISAQHCPYDGSSIIVLKVHAPDNSNTIPNLKVTLVKKKQDKIVKSRVYILTQTNKFPFLSDEYSIIVGHNFDTENWYLKIESVCEYGDNNYTTLETTEIKITENDKYNLCGNFDSYEYHTGFGERDYKPIEVIFRKGNCDN